ncbi:hypothetical protein [Spiroplasma clarkii]|uniref:hypothetical protein n=1 Tax=Spiroplasma clarkii TaxID=2139 RepID=UPI001F2B9A76|nr:hypothetical protein [Spiroplasma clarkii]
MLDINRIETDFEKVCRQLNTRQKDYTKDLKDILELNSKRKELTKIVEEMKAQKINFQKKLELLHVKTKSRNWNCKKTSIWNFWKNW